MIAVTTCLDTPKLIFLRKNTVDNLKGIPLKYENNSKAIMTGE